jgi:hypothetical protein
MFERSDVRCKIFTAVGFLHGGSTNIGKRKLYTKGKKKKKYKSIEYTI